MLPLRARLVSMLLLLVLCLATPGLAQWTTLPPVPDVGYVFAHAPVVFGDRLYLFGGILPDGTANQYDSTVRVLPLDAPTAWQSVSKMPRKRAGHYAAVHEGRIFLVSGLYRVSKRSANLGDSTVLEYDPAADTYTERATAPRTIANHGAATVGSKIYMIGGYKRGIVTDEVLTYDMATDEWSMATPLPIRAAYMAVEAVGNRIFVVGGSDSTFEDRIADAFVGTVDGNVITWSRIASLPAAMHSAAAGTIAGQLYIAGGITSQGRVRTTYRYDEEANRWRSLAMLPATSSSVRQMPAWHDALYHVGGGIEGNSRNAAYRFTDATVGIEEEPVAERVQVMVEPGAIVVNGSERVSVYAIDGSFVGQGQTRFEVVPGVYVVRAGAVSRVAVVSSKK